MEDLNISSNSISEKNDFWLGSSKEKNNSLMRNRKKRKRGQTLKLTRSLQRTQRSFEF